MKRGRWREGWGGQGGGRRRRRGRREGGAERGTPARLHARGRARPDARRVPRRPCANAGRDGGGREQPALPPSSRRAAAAVFIKNFKPPIPTPLDVPRRGSLSGSKLPVLRRLKRILESRSVGEFHCCRGPARQIPAMDGRGADRDERKTDLQAPAMDGRPPNFGASRQPPRHLT